MSVFRLCDLYVMFNDFVVIFAPDNDIKVIPLSPFTTGSFILLGHNATCSSLATCAVIFLLSLVAFCSCFNTD